MKGIAFLSGFITGLLALGIILPAPAQITSDGTTNTTVNSIGNNFTILNGIQRGNNLFHSFKEFSIPTGGSATFQNPSAIENIINRVTGGNISNIDGLIKANASASVFLINPGGIVFGENARLDIGGSFLGTTAESILFEDGFEFSAVNAQSEPLLTISVPLGLQMGQNRGDITVQGTGYTIATENPFKKERPWYFEIHSQVLQEVPKRVEKAFDRWLKGDVNGEQRGLGVSPSGATANPKGKKSGRPRFKGKGQYKTFTYKQFKQHHFAGNKILMG